MANASTRYFGTYPPGLWYVLQTAWEGHISLQSNFAREHSVLVALAASCGWLSTIDPDGKSYRTQWHLTAAGLTALQNKELFA